MSDRRLRETTFALPQRLAFSETRLRAMQLRAWPGAMRTAATEVYTPSDPGVSSPAVSVTVASGRWLILGEGYFHVNPSIGSEHFEWTFGATNPDTGESYIPEVFDSPRRYWRTGITGQYLDIPFSLSGDISVSGDIENDPQRVTVSLLVRNLNSTGFDPATGFGVYHSRLRLIPI